MRSAYCALRAGRNIRRRRKFAWLIIQRVGRNRFIAPLTHSRSRFFGRDRNSWPLASNVQQVISGERRNKAIAPYDFA
jgi:hypothetical protein